MSCPGLLGLPRASSVLTPESLTAALTSLLGSTLIGLWVGEDIEVSDDSVTSWPGRVGPTLSVTGTYLVSQIGGRKYTRAHDNDTAHWLAGELSAVPLDFVTVTGIPSTAGNAIVGVPTGCILCNDPTPGLWYNLADWTHYRNGVADETCVATTTPVIIEATKASNTVTDIEIGGRSATPRSWTSDFSFVMALSAVQSEANRAAANDLIKSYYSLA